MFISQVSTAIIDNLVHLIADLAVAIAVEDVDLDAVVEEVHVNGSDGVHQLLRCQRATQESLKSDREVQFLSPSYERGGEFIILVARKSVLHQAPLQNQFRLWVFTRCSQRERERERESL